MSCGVLRSDDMINNTNNFDTLQNQLKKDVHLPVFIRNNIFFRVSIITSTLFSLSIGYIFLPMFYNVPTLIKNGEIGWIIFLVFILLVVLFGIVYNIIDTQKLLCNGFRFSSRGIESVYPFFPSKLTPWENLEVSLCETVTSFEEIKPNGKKKKLTVINREETEKILSILVAYAFDRASYVEKYSPVVEYMDAIKEDKDRSKDSTVKNRSNIENTHNSKQRNLYIPYKTTFLDRIGSLFGLIIFIASCGIFLATLLWCIISISENDFSALSTQLGILLFTLYLIFGIKVKENMLFCEGYTFSPDHIEINYSYFPNKIMPWKNIQVRIYDKGEQSINFEYDTSKRKPEDIYTFDESLLERVLPYVSNYAYRRKVTVIGERSLTEYIGSKIGTQETTVGNSPKLSLPNPNTFKTKEKLFIPHTTDSFEWTAFVITSLLAIGLIGGAMYILIVSSNMDYYFFLFLMIIILTAKFVMNLTRGIRMPLCKGYTFSSSTIEAHYAIFPNIKKKWEDTRITLYHEQSVHILYNNWEQKERQMCDFFETDMESVLPYIYAYGKDQIANVEKEPSLTKQN